MKLYWGRVKPDSNMTYVLIRRRSYEAKEHHEENTLWPWMREWGYAPASQGLPKMAIKIPEASKM